MFQPALIGTGYAAWRGMQAMKPALMAQLQADPAHQRDSDYFRANIATIQTAADLVADRRMLNVALTAFGLKDDLSNRAFIEKILAEGSLAEDAFVNRLSDQRYRDLSAAFSFDLSPPRTALSGFADEILLRFDANQFEVAVGQQQDDLRQALYTLRQLPEIISDGSSEDAKWFRIMGLPPLRRVFEVALGLPASFGQLDLDRQLAEFKTRSEQRLDPGGLAALAQGEVQEKLVQRFLLGQQINAVPVVSAGAIALTLLQASTR